MQDPADIPASTPMDDWFDALSRPTGSPGGGAAAGVMLAIAASLMSMVGGYSDDDPRAADILDRLARQRAEALRAVEADGIVSASFGAALALATDDPSRDERVRDAAVEGARSAARVGLIGVGMLQDVRVLVEVGNPHIVVDLAVAAEALLAGLSGASLNVRANLQIARRHRSPAAEIADLEAEIRRLADARRQVAQIIDELSARLD
ncbi:cyclodeaminase/cyclohydrolase family protein [Microbacterium sp. WCS2018Hpa-9]|uniref:cyclodeaminase/cyclohydrolase family protein n=1 Tax=Microbacterium sp. WCS2018Hpa-9 TaxID=3073635 RepID=UPI002889F27F|nr:cyclodeaminase/cyclohydrolase family protein [Microbacterium sp. WCS2018Hpa-9]